MTYREFQRQLGKAGLSINEFASLVRMNKNSISNCSKKNAVPSHLAVIATLMGEMAEHKVDFRAPLSSIEIEKKAPRGGPRLGLFGGRDEKKQVTSGTSQENQR